MVKSRSDDKGEGGALEERGATLVCVTRPRSDTNGAGDSDVAERDSLPKIGQNSVCCGR